MGQGCRDTTMRSPGKILSTADPPRYAGYAFPRDGVDTDRLPVLGEGRNWVLNRLKSTIPRDSGAVLGLKRD